MSKSAFLVSEEDWVASEGGHTLRLRDLRTILAGLGNGVSDGEHSGGCDEKEQVVQRQKFPVFLAFRADGVVLGTSLLTLDFACFPFVPRLANWLTIVE
jgi:hypothetical protein